MDTEGFHLNAMRDYKIRVCTDTTTLGLNKGTNIDVANIDVMHTVFGDFQFTQHKFIGRSLDRVVI